MKVHNSFRKFAKALEKIDVQKLYLQSVKETSDLAIELNQQQLTEQGIRADGESLGNYAESSKKKGHITLRDTGDFQEAIFVEAKQLPILMDSKDWKTRILEARYGEEILGLTEQNKDIYRAEVLKVFEEKITAKIDKAKDQAFH